MIDQTVDLLNIADDTKFSPFDTREGEPGNGSKVAWRLHNLTETHDHFTGDVDEQPAFPPPSSPLAPGSPPYGPPASPALRRRLQALPPPPSSCAPPPPLPAAQWVTLLNDHGTASETQLKLQFSPRGLAETSAAEPYTAVYYFEVMDVKKEGRDYVTERRILPMPVSVEVRATVSAEASVWGGVDSGRCGVEAHQTLVLYHSRFSKVRFTACDADALPVNHQLPRPGARNVAGDDRSFGVSIVRWPEVTPDSYKPLTWKPVVVYVAAGRYDALVELNSGLGNYELALDLNGTETCQRQAVHVVCPPPLLPMPDLLSCGCEKGLYPTEFGECLPCEEGYYKPFRGMDLCDACPVGTHQRVTGQTSCLNCARGSFQASRPTPPALRHPACTRAHPRPPS